MEVLEQLLYKMLPLYGFILIGWAIRKKWTFNSRWISKTLLYFLIPYLIIEKLLRANLEEAAVVGSVIFILACLMNIPAYLIRNNIGKGYNTGMLQAGFSYYNIGWFGIPVVMALFGENGMPFIISAYVGNALYGDTIGYYMISQINASDKREAIKKVFKIPAVYACVAAILLNLFSVEAPELVEQIGEGISWLVSALGMLVIGVTLATVSFKNFDYKGFSKILGLRYLCGILILSVLIFIEHQFIQILDEDQSKLLFLIGTFPIAANLVVFASFLKAEEKSAALLVGISSLISLLLVPLACFILF